MPPRKKQKTEDDVEKKPPGDGKSSKKTTPAKSPAVGKSSKTRSKSPAAPGVTTRNGASTALPEEACTDPENAMKANHALRREEKRNASLLAELKARNAALLAATKLKEALLAEAKERGAALLADAERRNAALLAALEAESKRSAALLAGARKRNAVLLAEARQGNAAVFDEAEQRNAALLAESRRGWETLLAVEQRLNASWLAEVVDGDQENVPLSKLKPGKRKKPEKSDVDGKAKSDAAAKSWSVSADIIKKTETEEEKAVKEAKRLSKGKMKMIDGSSSSPAMVHVDWDALYEFTEKYTKTMTESEVLRLSKGTSEQDSAVALSGIIPKSTDIDKAAKEAAVAEDVEALRLAKAEGNLDREAALKVEAQRLSKGKGDVDWAAPYQLIPQMTEIDKAAKEAVAKKAQWLSNGKSKMTNDLIPVKKRRETNTSGTKIIMIRFCNASGPLFVKKAEELKTAITTIGWKAEFETVVAKGYFEVREAGGGESIVLYENLSPPYDELRKLEPGTVIRPLLEYL